MHKKNFNKLFLPGDIEYEITLANPRLYWMAKNDKQVEISGWICDSFSGLPKAVTRKELLDYIYGGEYEETLENMGYDFQFEHEYLKNLPPNTEIYIDI